MNELPKAYTVVDGPGPRQVTCRRGSYSVTVSEDAWTAWNCGELAQRAFPELSDDQREFLISNTTPEEWDEIFKDDEIFNDDEE